MLLSRKKTNKACNHFTKAINTINVETEAKREKIVLSFSNVFLFLGALRTVSRVLLYFH